MKLKQTIELNFMEKGVLFLGTTFLVNKFNKVQKVKREKKRLVKTIERRIARSDGRTQKVEIPKPGHAIGILNLPNQRKTIPIIEGDRPKDLNKGVGHHRGSGWPNENKQIFISGHRQTDFGILKKVVVGEPIEIKTEQGIFTYHVTGMKVVHEKDTWVIDKNTTLLQDQVVLMTCYPFTFAGGTKKRYLVYAE